MKLPPFTLRGDKALKVAAGPLAVVLGRLKRDGVPMREATVTNIAPTRTDEAAKND